MSDRRLTAWRFVAVYPDGTSEDVSFYAPNESEAFKVACAWAERVGAGLERVEAEGANS